MSLHIYNSLSRKKEEFLPVKKGRAGIYVCGPTVYDEPHIGHARSAYIFDVIVRYLRYKKLKITFARNVTDIDDKIIDRARREQTPGDLKSKVRKIAEIYLERYHEDMALLSLARPNKEPKATETIRDMIAFIQILIKKGYAYAVSGNVYFDVRRFAEYGRLSGQSLDEMEEGARVSVDKNKKDPLDFALWKASKEDEPSWKSPWGEGRPGWHIECSVMSTKILGRDFDIHGGGLDLIFPHHENEIAQTVCAGRKSADYWIHNGLLTINGQKMAKSLGNFISVKEILKRYHPEVLKLFFLSGHYRSPIDFTYDKMENIAQARETFYILFNRIDYMKDSTPQPVDSEAQPDPSIKTPEEYKELFIKSMDDDFNMTQALGYLYMIRNGVNRLIDSNKWDRKTLASFKKILLELGGILGFFKDTEEFKKRTIIEGRVKKAIEARDDARRRGDYKKADEIRKRLSEEGIILEDIKEGTVWRRKA